jgi:tetratricopeptide (TPR) repeat protein
MCVRLILAIFFMAGGAEGGARDEACRAAQKSYSGGSYREAAAAYETCHNLVSDPADRAGTAADVGIALMKAGSAEPAIPWLRRALDIWASVSGGADYYVRTALWLVEAERSLGHFAAVDPILREALKTHPTAPLEAELRCRFSVILRETGHPDEARAELQKVLAVPAATPDQRIDALTGLAELDRHNMRFQESLDDLNEAMKIALKQGDGRTESDVLQGLGLTWMCLGDPARAEAELKRSLALAESGAGSTPQRIGTALQSLAALHVKYQKYSLAEEELRQALVLLGKALSEGHPQIAAVTADLADVCRLEKRFDEASEYAHQAHEAMRRSLGDNSPGVAETLGLIARIEVEQSKSGEAEGDYARAISMFRENGGSHDIRLATLMNEYASLLVSMHRKEEAKQVQTELKAFCLASCANFR